MKMRSRLLAALILLLPFASTGQDESTSSKDLSQQYKELKEAAETYNDYKVIRESRLDDWFKAIGDSLQSLRSEVRKEENYSSKLNDSIASLNSEMNELNNSMAEYEEGQTHISVLGINFSKKGFVLLFFMIIAALAATLVFLIIKFIDNQRITSETVREHTQLTTEFEEYKKRALEKQTRLARDLQTARNKLEESRRKR